MVSPVHFGKHEVWRRNGIEEDACRFSCTFSRGREVASKDTKGNLNVKVEEEEGN